MVHRPDGPGNKGQCQDQPEACPAQRHRRRKRAEIDDDQHFNPEEQYSTIHPIRDDPSHRSKNCKRHEVKPHRHSNPLRRIGQLEHQQPDDHLLADPANPIEPAPKCQPDKVGVGQQRVTQDLPE